MSPMLNSPSLAWSASSGMRVCHVALCHIGLAGTTVDGIPTTGIDPALLSVTKAFIPSPQSISRTPVRTNITDNHFAGMKPHADPNLRKALFTQLSIDSQHPPLHRDCCVECI